MTYRLGFDVFRVLPVQPFAAGQAKLRPPVRRFRHPHEAAAFQAAEDAQRFFFPRRPAMVIDAVPMGVPPAVSAAVFLRHAACFEFLAADETYRCPFHSQVADALAAS